MFSRLGFLTLTLTCPLLSACFSEPPSMDAESSSGPASSSTAPQESSTTDVEPSDASSSSSSTGVQPPLGCNSAADAAACSGASDPDFEVCGWQPAYTFDLQSCQRISTDSGQCVVEQGLDGCGEPLETCEDGTSWYYRVADDTVEVIDATGSCYGLGDFEPCPFGGSSESSSSDSVGTSVGTSVGDTGDFTSTSTDGGTFPGEAVGTGAGEVGGSSGAWSLDDEIAAVCACACDS